MRITYKYNDDNPAGPLRTDDLYNDDVKKAINEGVDSNGVKGYLNYFDFFNPISGTCIDYMHSVLEGVVKSLFKLWFGQECHEMKTSLRRFMQTIDSRLLNIKPPKFIPTTPRSIYSWKTWRAH